MEKKLLMYSLVDAETLKTGRGGYGHTYLVYVAEQWAREGNQRIISFTFMMGWFACSLFTSLWFRGFFNHFFWSVKMKLKVCDVSTPFGGKQKPYTFKYKNDKGEYRYYVEKEQLTFKPKGMDIFHLVSWDNVPNVKQAENRINKHEKEE